MLLAGSEWWPFLRATEPQNSLNGGQTLSSNPLSCHFIPPQVRCIKYKCLHDILSHSSTIYQIYVPMSLYPFSSDVSNISAFITFYPPPQVWCIKYTFPCHFILPQVRCTKYICFHDIFFPTGHIKYIFPCHFIPLKLDVSNMCVFMAFFPTWHIKYILLVTLSPLK